MRFIARLNVGGPARHVVWLHEALASGALAEEFTPLLVTGTVPPGEVDMQTFAAAHGVTPIIVPSMSREMSLRDLFAVWDVWRLMVRLRPDVVHTHTAKAGAVGRLAGLLYRFVTPSLLLLRPRRCKFVHTYHGHIFRHYYGATKTRLVLFMERLLARINTDRIIVLGEQQLQEIRDTFAVGRPEQYVIVPLGIELLGSRRACPAKARPCARHGASAPTETVVGIVGRLAAIKNHDLFLRVAARTANGTRFVVYGDGGERDRLVHRAAELEIEDRIVFAGTREADEIYASLDVAALTSRNEGTPLAIIEAMAAGKPVMSTAVGGVVDLLGAVEQRIETNGSFFEIRERGLTAPLGRRGRLLAAHWNISSTTRRYGAGWSSEARRTSNECTPDSASSTTSSASIASSRADDHAGTPPPAGPEHRRGSPAWCTRSAFAAVERAHERVDRPDLDRRAAGSLSTMFRLAETRRRWAPSALLPAEEIARRIDRVFHAGLVTDGSCWKRAAVLRRYLMLNGIETEVVFGVRRENGGATGGPRVAGARRGAVSGARAAAVHRHFPPPIPVTQPVRDSASPALERFLHDEAHRCHSERGQVFSMVELHGGRERAHGLFQSGVGDGRRRSSRENRRSARAECRARPRSWPRPRKAAAVSRKRAGGHSAR